MTDIEKLIIQTLARLRRRDPAEMEADLRENGCDSVWLVKAAVKVARELGFELKPAASDARHFKSVQTLTAYLEVLRDA